MNTSSAFNPTKPRDINTPKGAVSELFAQVGGMKMVQNRLGIGSTRANAFTDPQSDEEISFARVAALTAPTATAAAEFLCFMAGGVFLPVVDAGHRQSIDLPKVAEQTKHHGNAIAALLGAIADGSISAAERQQVLVHIDAELRGLATMRACLVASGDQ